MRNKPHHCYTCSADAMTLCQRCTAKSCLDHLTSVKMPYSRLLLCDECVTKSEQEKRNGRCLLAIMIFGVILMSLVSASH